MRTTWHGITHIIQPQFCECVMTQRAYHVFIMWLAEVGRGSRILAYYRLPKTFIIHVNRAQPDGSRCAMALKFGMTLDVRGLGLVRCGPAPLDRDLEPCESHYTLYAAVFHQGVVGMRHTGQMPATRELHKQASYLSDTITAQHEYW